MCQNSVTPPPETPTPDTKTKVTQTRKHPLKKMLQLLTRLTPVRAIVVAGAVKILKPLVETSVRKGLEKAKEKVGPAIKSVKGFLVRPKIADYGTTNQYAVVPHAIDANVGHPITLKSNIKFAIQIRPTASRDTPGMLIIEVIALRKLEQGHEELSWKIEFDKPKSPIKASDVYVSFDSLDAAHKEGTDPRLFIASRLLAESGKLTLISMADGEYKVKFKTREKFPDPYETELRLSSDKMAQLMV